MAGEFRVVTTDGWIFTAKAKPGEAFPFAQVKPNQMTFLGNKYLLELSNKKVDGNSVTGVFTTGDFSGCFGAGCGDPVNVRAARVTVVNGVMSTKIVVPPPQKEY